jgi:hypothetical protein
MFGDGRIGVVGDCRLGGRQHSGSDLLRASLEVSEYSKCRVARFAPCRRPLPQSTAVAVLRNVCRSANPNPRGVGVGDRGLAFLPGAVGPNGDLLSSPLGKLGSGGQQSGDERPENASHARSL